MAEKEDSDGLQFLLMAKQHAARGEDGSALRMYKLAEPYFPGNAKLRGKIAAVEEKIRRKRSEETAAAAVSVSVSAVGSSASKKRGAYVDPDDGDYQDEASQDQLAQDDDEYDEEDGFRFKAKARKAGSGGGAAKKAKLAVFRDLSASSSSSAAALAPGEQTPRTKQLISIINSRDVSQIKTLKGVGTKKAEAIVTCLVDMADEEIVDLEQLGGLKGVGLRGVENMRAGLMV